jgi:hypothetical protein
MPYIIVCTTLYTLRWLYTWRPPGLLRQWQSVAGESWLRREKEITASVRPLHLVLEPLL